MVAVDETEDGERLHAKDSMLHPRNATNISLAKYLDMVVSSPIQ